MAHSSKRAATPSPKTPNECFSPIILPVSPAELANQRNITGLPRVIRDIAADIYNNIQRWNSKHITGAAIVKQIAIFKSQSSEQLPSGLESLVQQLFDIVQCMQTHCNALIFCKNQFTALVKVQKDNEPLFMMLSIEQMARIVQEIVEAYENEFKAKQHVLENIAFSRSDDEVLFYSANWAHQIYISSDVSFKLEQLLTETGHRRII